MSSPGLAERPQIPTTGMRGGLGRTLLTAFLVMAIVPLSIVSWYTIHQERHDVQREVTAKLSSVAGIMEAQVRQWVESRSTQLALIAALPSVKESTSAMINKSKTSDIDSNNLQSHLHPLLTQDPAFRCVALHDDRGHVLLSAGACTDIHADVDHASDAGAPTTAITTSPDQITGLHRSFVVESTGDMSLAVIEPIIGPSDETIGLLSGWLSLDSLSDTMEAVGGLGNTGEIYLVDANGVASLQGERVSSSGIEIALSGRNTQGLHKNYAGIPVIGVYCWMPDLKMALIAEQTQEEAFARTDNITAAVVGATLVAALATAVIAAIVTRQITRPIVQLTESALSIANGDMDQQVPVTSQDEIGILAYVFNRMVAELKTLYENLEEKVAQRTALLQKANYQIQRRAIQLATTVDVSQAATSILEPDELLREVVRLVHDSFGYSYVGIYLLDKDKQQARLKEARGGGKEVASRKAAPIPVNTESAIGHALSTGEPSIVNFDAERALEIYGSPYIRAEAALPLRISNQSIGVLDILSTEEMDADHPDAHLFDADAISVLQNVANQITIALENARAYAVEREAAKRLRELDRSKRRFLANMSHELRTPLTNILGFSQLMLKGIDGPLTETQQQDLEIVYHNGQHLLGLINDLLDISHIEAGLMELEFREVDLADLIQSVMATASALVRDKDIELHQKIAPNLPKVTADATRIRQVLLRLLANAAKFTKQGTITVRCRSIDGQVLLSVSDTGIGISPEDQKRIFERFEHGGMENRRRTDGAGLGLALSKEFVEMHGGKIWVESEVGRGSTFTLALPLQANPRPAVDARIEEEKKKS